MKLLSIVIDGLMYYACFSLLFTTSVVNHVLDQKEKDAPKFHEWEPTSKVILALAVVVTTLIWPLYLATRLRGKGQDN